MELPDGQITINEAIRLTNYSRQNLYIMIRMQKIKSRKTQLGEISFHLIDRDSLLAYCRQQERSINEAE